MKAERKALATILGMKAPLAVASLLLCSTSGLPSVASENAAAESLPPQTYQYIVAGLDELMETQDLEVRTKCSFEVEGEQTEEGLDLIVALSCDGGETLTARRTATVASAASQARSMARDLLEQRSRPLDSVKTRVGIRLDSIEAKRETFLRSTALKLSLLPTTLLTAVGFPVFMICIFEAPSDPDELLYSGLAMWLGGVIAGPSLGYFYIGHHTHALGWGALRLLAFGGGCGLFLVFDRTASENEPLIPTLLNMHGLITLIGSIVDAALVGRATDRENRRRKEAKAEKPSVSIAPVPVMTPMGRIVPGVGVQMSF